ncbi:MAG TPA: alpha-amylase family glycosyl hydrolase [Candidatus Saccharimonadales bacterium]|nr:alpha-amylase family glycosyl hydrolase [Candidatus Saccharimonadales bacterium]
MAVSETHQTKPAAAPKSGNASYPWWKTGVIYQIYVRSFYDTNGDGVGDLPGVIAKLDYIRDLGVDAIWLSPVVKSANFDWGYDVTDYYSIEPSIGTMEDFDRLIAGAEERGIKVIFDFIPNHTSTEHPWFQNALTGTHAQYRDYYIWRSPKRDGRPPNNWRAADDGGSAWEYHSPTGQFYLHNWWKQQADLNWRNPEVLEEFDKIMRFWLDRGVAGFRLDVFNMLIKDAQFRDNPKSQKGDGPEIRLLHQRPLYNTSQPEVHTILKRWRAIVDEYPDKRLLLGETNRVYDARLLASFYGQQDELKLIFNLAFLDSPFEVSLLRDLVEKSELALTHANWPMWTATNHDKPRFPSRWAKGDERKIRCALLTMVTLRGTPVIYYGDELGMADVFVAPWRLKDPRGRKYWPVDGGRDRSRTPMPWKNQVGAGFTEKGVRPWLPYGELHTRNVDAETDQEDSTLHFTRDLIKLRHRLPALQVAAYEAVDSNDSVWAWHRSQAVLVAINFSNHHHELRDVSGEIVLGTVRHREGEAVTGLLHLGPWEGVVVEQAATT